MIGRYDYGSLRACAVESVWQGSCRLDVDYAMHDIYYGL